MIENSLVSLDQNIETLTNQIAAEDSVTKVKDLTELFNLNIAKKNAFRLLKLIGLLDKIDNQIIERFEKNPGNFSNKDLLDYLQTIEKAISNANDKLNLVQQTNIPQIQQQTNQVNINIIESMDRDSRDRVANAVKFLLSQVNNKEEDKSNVD